MTSRVMFLDCSIGWGHLRLVRLFFFFLMNGSLLFCPVLKLIHFSFLLRS